MTDKQPIIIMNEDSSRKVGRDAQRNNIMAARIVADTVKTTLGPKGMDKMLVSSTGDITVTNDGVTILEEMEIEHPAAKMIVEIAKTQDKEVGDGTTSAVMLAGKLLENAEKLLDQKIHPTVITKGYRLASEKAQEIIKNIALDINNNDSILKELVYTSLASKNASAKKEKFAEIIVKAVKQIYDNGVDLDNIKIEKVKGEGIEDTELIEGIALDKERVSIDMPSKIENAKIALIDSALEIMKPETETKISVSSPEQLQSFLEREERIIKEMVFKIKSSGANVVFCQKGIDDVAQYYLARDKIFACRRVSKSDMEKLARATGAKIISNLNEISPEQLGNANLVESSVKDSGMTYVKGCKNPKALTILIRGGTEHIISEIERALKDGMGVIASVLKDKKILPGAGAIEVELAKATGGKIVSNINELSASELGNAELVEEVKHGSDAFTYVRGCRNPKAVTILIHGGTEHVIDEIERAIRDGLGVVSSSLKTGLIVPGGGAIEVELARRLRIFGQSLSGREQLAVEEFASALEFIPTTLAENAGMDPIDVLTELKSKHDAGEKNAGLNLFTNKIENVLDARIIEPYKIKTQAISSATEVANMILRIDDVIASSGGKNKAKFMDHNEEY